MTSAAWLTTGAVVLSTGFGRLGANANNTYSGYVTQAMGAQPANTGMTDDTHLRAACQATGPGTTLATQLLRDISILEFDITPTISGPLVFRYVFGEGWMHGAAVHSCSAAPLARAPRHWPVPGCIPMPVCNTCSAQPDTPPVVGCPWTVGSCHTTRCNAGAHSNNTC